MSWACFGYDKFAHVAVIALYLDLECWPLVRGALHGLAAALALVDRMWDYIGTA